jgi:hypothetical protein
MDHEHFDRFVRLLGTPGSRRAALGALFGATVASAAADTIAKRHGKGKRRTSQHRDRGRKTKPKNQPAAPAGTADTLGPLDAEVSAQAAPDCANPGPSKNLQGCNFNGQNLAGIDLSSSNLKNARFNGTNLCGADLSSSTLTNVDFRNTNLTKADLHSSGCGGVQTNAGTTFCQTIMCNGTVRNDDCPGTDPALICCFADECAPRACQTATCNANSRCVYAEQPDNQPGTLCLAQRVCCDGDCCETDEYKCCGDSCIFRPSCCTNGQEGCPDGQKCCGGSCIPETTCCTNNVPGFCPPELSECCGGECIDPATECCGNNDPGCPPGETCVIHETFGPDCCPDARACGPRCRTTPCSELCGVCNEQTGGCTSICEDGTECCLGNCKLPSGAICENDDQCCIQVCQGTPKVCCTEEGLLCSDDFECCGTLVCDDSTCEEP